VVRRIARLPGMPSMLFSAPIRPRADGAVIERLQAPCLIPFFYPQKAQMAEIFTPPSATYFGHRWILMDTDEGASLSIFSTPTGQ